MEVCSSFGPGFLPGHSEFALGRVSPGFKLYLPDAFVFSTFTGPCGGFPSPFLCNLKPISYSPDFEVSVGLRSAVLGDVEAGEGLVEPRFILRTGETECAVVFISIFPASLRISIECCSIFSIGEFPLDEPSDSLENSESLRISWHCCAVNFISSSSCGALSIRLNMSSSSSSCAKQWVREKKILEGSKSWASCHFETMLEFCSSYNNTPWAYLKLIRIFRVYLDFLHVIKNTGYKEAIHKCLLFTVVFIH